MRKKQVNVWCIKFRSIHSNGTSDVIKISGDPYQYTDTSKLLPTSFHENPKTNPEFPQLYILTNLDNNKKQKMWYTY